MEKRLSLKASIPNPIPNSNPSPNSNPKCIGSLQPGDPQYNGKVCGLSDVSLGLIPACTSRFNVVIGMGELCITKLSNAERKGYSFRNGRMFLEEH